MSDRHECQVCERLIKAPQGLIANHGYKRPAAGWQTSGCPGARHAPYPEGRDAIARAIQVVTGLRDRTFERVADVFEGLVDVPTNRSRYDRGSRKNLRVMVEPSSEEYDYWAKLHINSLLSDAVRLQADIDHFQARHDRQPGLAEKEKAK